MIPLDPRAIAFCPMEASCSCRVVHLQGGTIARNFWLLDLATKTTRQLSDLADETDRGDIGTFDVTPDGKQIIFDRRSDNSESS